MLLEGVCSVGVGYAYICCVRGKSVCIYCVFGGVFGGVFGVEYSYPV